MQTARAGEHAQRNPVRGPFAGVSRHRHMSWQAAVCMIRKRSSRAHSSINNARFLQQVQSMAQRTAALLLTLSLACGPPAHAAVAAETFQGVPRIVDGDTLVVSGHACRWGLSTCVTFPINGSSKAYPGSAQLQPGTQLFCQVDGKKVRLFGLDAPESKQSCQAADGSQYLCGTATKAYPMLWTCRQCRASMTITVAPVAPWLALTSRVLNADPHGVLCRSEGHRATAGQGRAVECAV